ncbi:MAG: hypothetical protein QM528_09045 [Phycisphaerales bacterium]|nr:hypothetical protein [Phycisphaerales bacterium]
MASDIQKAIGSDLVLLASTFTIVASPPLAFFDIFASAHFR